jgi:hypothetical protein
VFRTLKVKVSVFLKGFRVFELAVAPAAVPSDTHHVFPSSKNKYYKRFFGCISRAY